MNQFTDLQYFFMNKMDIEQPFSFIYYKSYFKNLKLLLNAKVVRECMLLLQTVQRISVKFGMEISSLAITVLYF